MVDSLPVTLIISTVLGFLSGLGTGGGSLLILWLTLVIGMEQIPARTINLLFFLPSAAISCLFHFKKGTLDIKKVLPAMAAGSLSAGIISYISTDWDVELLKKGFGILLIFTGIRELFYRPRKRK